MTLTQTLRRKKEIDTVLNKKSGLLGISGVSSVSRDIEAGIKEGYSLSTGESTSGTVVIDKENTSSPSFCLKITILPIFNTLYKGIILLSFSISVSNKILPF